MHPFHSYINKHFSLPILEEEFDFILNHFHFKRLKKKQFLLEENHVCKYMAFILKGSMCKYYIDENGAEHIVNLYIENWWASDRESFVDSTPTDYYIEAYEDCEVLLISRKNLLKLCNESSIFQELVFLLDEKNAIATQKRIIASISFQAVKRYEDFIKRHPYFVQRFPQHIIASYLGVTKDTISRVRKMSVKR